MRGDQMTGKQKTCKLMDGSERTLKTVVVNEKCNSGMPRSRRLKI